jgi:3-oxoadipate enol-lactonase
LPRVRVNDVELYYEEHGSGEPLLLIPPTGWPGSVWQLGMEQRLSPHYRVIIYDQRGIGRSDKPDQEYTARQLGEDALGLLRAMGAEPAHVLGFSVGGQSAQLAAMDSPDSFRSLILAGSSAGEAPGGQGFIRPQVALTMFDPGYDHPTYWEHHLRMGFTFTPEFREEHPEKIAELADTIRRHQAPAKLYLRHIIARTAHWSGDRLSQIRVRTLVLAGELDRAHGAAGSDAGASEQLARAIPGARLESVPGARHLFPWEAPEATSEAVLRFLRAEAP